MHGCISVVSTQSHGQRGSKIMPCRTCGLLASDDEPWPLRRYHQPSRRLCQVRLFSGCHFLRDRAPSTQTSQRQQQTVDSGHGLWPGCLPPGNCRRQQQKTTVPDHRKAVAEAPLPRAPPPPPFPRSGPGAGRSRGGRRVFVDAWRETPGVEPTRLVFHARLGRREGDPATRTEQNTSCSRRWDLHTSVPSATRHAILCSLLGLASNRTHGSAESCQS